MCPMVCPGGGHCCLRPWPMPAASLCPASTCSPQCLTPSPSLKWGRQRTWWVLFFFCSLFFPSFVSASSRGRQRTWWGCSACLPAMLCCSLLCCAVLRRTLALLGLGVLRSGALQQTCMRSSSSPGSDSGAQCSASLHGTGAKGVVQCGLATIAACSSHYRCPLPPSFPLPSLLQAPEVLEHGSPRELKN